uniref:18S rRNA (guanine-N(7))-methyltransferase n=1 Tax=Plectus sambesii TaxID=2011161 RepID=A0A914XPE3_9BILA
FYDETESQKYSSNSHIIAIQAEMTERAMELLALPEDNSALILDVGCGSGLSGEVVTDAGHMWIGMDISLPMLNVAVEREVSGDLILKDMGHGVPFKAGTFDGAISISALQWLCHANASDQNPRKRLLRFFQSLYASLARGARAVFQFYPENSDQSELITQQAVKAGFSGGLVIDFPNSSKAKKVFLVLMTGGPQLLPKGLSEESGSHHVANAGRRTFAMASRDKKGKPSKGSRAWIESKKERARKQGKDVKESSKYTGRKRRRL